MRPPESTGWSWSSSYLDLFLSATQSRSRCFLTIPLTRFAVKFDAPKLESVTVWTAVSLRFIEWLRKAELDFFASWWCVTLRGRCVWPAEGRIGAGFLLVPIGWPPDGNGRIGPCPPRDSSSGYAQFRSTLRFRLRRRVKMFSCPAPTHKSQVISSRLTSVQVSGPQVSSAFRFQLFEYFNVFPPLEGSRIFELFISALDGWQTQRVFDGYRVPESLILRIGTRS